MGITIFPVDRELYRVYLGVFTDNVWFKSWHRESHTDRDYLEIPESKLLHNSSGLHGSEPFSEHAEVG